MNVGKLAGWSLTEQKPATACLRRGIANSNIKAVSIDPRQYARIKCGDIVDEGLPSKD